MDCYLFESEETGEIIAVEHEDSCVAHEIATEVFGCNAIYYNCISTEEAEEEGFDIF